MKSTPFCGRATSIPSILPVTWGAARAMPAGHGPSWPLRRPLAASRLVPQTPTFVRVNYGKVLHFGCQTPAARTRTRVNGCKLLEFRVFQWPLWIRRVLVRAQEGQLEARWLLAAVAPCLFAEGRAKSATLRTWLNLAADTAGARSYLASRPPRRRLRAGDLSASWPRLSGHVARGASGRDYAKGKGPLLFNPALQEIRCHTF